ncbi:transmembrane protein 94 [Plakobranchus ocellatus]|uniref:Transmembrane protein 94 n=1 Tax=Plakobranchus ocellatus TaxID=259542 RepID=A0AAV4BII5_9GAST|nr:transmembrane protein 94 [Plakobranchus ocellatus]
MSASENTPGLSTTDALQYLHSELCQLVDDHVKTLKKSQWREFVSSMCSKSSCFTPVSFACILIMGVSLLVAAFVNSNNKSSSGTKVWLIIEALFLLSSVAINCVLHRLHMRRKFYKHTQLKVEYLETLRAAASNIKWDQKRYPALHTPISPCISLQWVIRDGHLVNLPHALLVEGDLIVMRPGMAAPGNCRSVEDDLNLSHDEIYCIPNSQAKGDGPQPRTPMCSKKFILQETPVLKNFRLMLGDETERPLSLLENERYTVTCLWLERRLLPIVFIVSLAMNIFRFIFRDKNGGHWSEFFIVLQVHGILPIVPIVLPGLWSVVNTFGQEYIFEAYKMFRSSQGTKCSVIYRVVVENYGEHAMSMTQVYQWCSWLKDGRTSLQDESRSGRPNTARVDELIKVGRRVKLKEISLKLDIPKTNVYEIVHDKLGYRKISARWVPKMLSDEHKR